METDLPIPIYIPIEEGIGQIVNSDNCIDYLESLLSTYIRDTPFRQKDIYDVHFRVREVLGPDAIPYAKGTVSRCLYTLRKEGKISLSEDNRNKEERFFWWAPSMPKPVKKVKTNNGPKTVDDSIPVIYDPRMSKFFAALFRSKLF